MIIVGIKKFRKNIKMYLGYLDEHNIYIKKYGKTIAVLKKASRIHRKAR